MLADDVACNPRNPYAGTVFNNVDHKLNLYGENVEVDYRGYEVTVENFIRVLTGRHPPDVPRSKRLLTDETSNVLVYLTGHGGDEFLKFQDAEEITSADLGDAFKTMHQKKRYNEILFLVDTCQAASLFERFYSPGIFAIGSSKLGQNSYSHHNDGSIGVSVIDRFTFYLLEFLETHDIKSSGTLEEMLDMFQLNARKINSDPQWRGDLFTRHPKDTPLIDFFGSAASTELVNTVYALPDGSDLLPNVPQNTPKAMEQAHVLTPKRSTTAPMSFPPLFVLGGIVTGAVFVVAIVVAVE